MNGFLVQQWNDAVNINVDYLNTPPPRNILFALTKTCDYALTDQPVGLLSAVGYSNIVNVDKLVESPEVQQGIQSGKE